MFLSQQWNDYTADLYMAKWALVLMKSEQSKGKDKDVGKKLASDTVQATVESRIQVHSRSVQLFGQWSWQNPGLL